MKAKFIYESLTNDFKAGDHVTINNKDGYPTYGKIVDFSDNIDFENNNGIIIQLPLPEDIDTEKILGLIPAEKDVDALSGKEIKPAILSPVLAGILALLKEYKIDFNGKKIAVIGRGRLVGQPVVDWFKKRDIDFSDDVKKADIIISGVGKPGFVINGDMIKNGAVVVDAAGDVDQKSVAPKAGYFTPTPGGVGPMTVAMVIKNLLVLNKIMIL